MKRLDVEQERMLQEAVAAAAGSPKRWPGSDVVLEVKPESVAPVERVVSEAVLSMTGGLAPAQGATGGQAPGGREAESFSSLVSSASGAVQPLVSLMPGQASNGGSNWVQWLNPIVGGLLSLFGGHEGRRDAAAQLFLSPRTIDFHLRNVFTKLGVSSRAELVALDLP